MGNDNSNTNPATDPTTNPATNPPTEKTRRQLVDEATASYKDVDINDFNNNLKQINKLTGGPKAIAGKRFTPEIFTDLGFDTLNKYDVGLIEGMDQNELRAANQNNWVAFGNGVANILPQVIGDIAYGIGSLGEIPEIFTKGYTDFDNALMRLGDEIRESNVFGEVYASKKAQQGFRFFDGEWWALNIGSVASAISLAIPAVGTIKALGVLGNLARYGKLSRAFRITDVTKKLGQGLTAKGLLRQQAAGFGQAIVSRHMEMMMEGKETFDEIYKAGLDKGLDEETAKEKAGEAAMAHYGLGYIAMLTDAPQYMMGLMGGKLGKVNKKSFMGLLKNMAGEGAEEIFQYILGEEARRYGHDPDKYTFGGMPLKKYFQDPALYTSGFFGALGGGVFYGGLGGVKDKISKFGNNISKVISSEDPESQAIENIIEDGVENGDQEDLKNTLKALNDELNGANPENGADSNLDAINEGLDASRPSASDDPNAPNDKKVRGLRGVRTAIGKGIENAKNALKNLFAGLGKSEAIDYNISLERKKELEKYLTKTGLTPYEKKAIAQLLEEEKKKIAEIEGKEGFNKDDFKIDKSNHNWANGLKTFRKTLNREIANRNRFLQEEDLKKGNISDDYIKTREIQFNRRLNEATNFAAYENILNDIDKELSNPKFSNSKAQEQKARDFYQNLRNKAKSQIAAKIAEEIDSTDMNNFESYEEYRDELMNKPFIKSLSKEEKFKLTGDQARKWDKKFPDKKSPAAEKLKYGLGTTFTFEGNTYQVEAYMAGDEGATYKIANVNNPKQTRLISRDMLETLMTKEEAKVPTPNSKSDSAQAGPASSQPNDPGIPFQGNNPPSASPKPSPSVDLTPPKGSSVKKMTRKEALQRKKDLEKELAALQKKIKDAEDGKSSKSMDDLFIALMDFVYTNSEVFKDPTIKEYVLNEILLKFNKGKTFAEIAKEISEKFNVNVKLSDVQRYYDTIVAPTQNEKSVKRKEAQLGIGRKTETEKEIDKLEAEKEEKLEKEVGQYKSLKEAFEELEDADYLFNVNEGNKSEDVNNMATAVSKILYAIANGGALSKEQQDILNKAIELFKNIGYDTKLLIPQTAENAGLSLQEYITSIEEKGKKLRTTNKARQNRINRKYDKQINEVKTREPKEFKFEYNTYYDVKDVREIFYKLDSSSRLKALFERVLKVISDFGIKVVFPSSETGFFKKGEAGRFDLVNGVIYINLEALMTSGEVSKALTHEMIHSALDYLFHLHKTNPSKLSEDQKDIIDDLNKIILALSIDPEFTAEYAISNAKELLAAMSDSRFMDKLKRKSTTSERTWLQVIIEKFLELLGFKTTYYDLVEEGFNRLLDSTSSEAFKERIPAKGEKPPTKSSVNEKNDGALNNNKKPKDPPKGKGPDLEDLKRKQTLINRELQMLEVVQKREDEKNKELSDFVNQMGPPSLEAGKPPEELIEEKQEELDAKYDKLIDEDLEKLNQQFEKEDKEEEKKKKQEQKEAKFKNGQNVTFEIDGERDYGIIHSYLGDGNYRVIVGYDLVTLNENDLSVQPDEDVVIRDKNKKAISVGDKVRIKTDEGVVEGTVTKVVEDLIAIDGKPIVGFSSSDIEILPEKKEGDVSSIEADIERRRQEELDNPVVQDEKRGENATITGGEFEINVTQKAFEETYSVDVSRRDNTSSTGYRIHNGLSKTFDTFEEALEYANKVARKDKEYQNKINAKYDAEYIKAVKEGTLTKEQAIQALERAGRKNSTAYSEIAGIDSDTKDTGKKEKPQTPNSLELFDLLYSAAVNAEDADTFTPEQRKKAAKDFLTLLSQLDKGYHFLTNKKGKPTKEVEDIINQLFETGSFSGLISDYLDDEYRLNPEEAEVSLLPDGLDTFFEYLKGLGGLSSQIEEDDNSSVIVTDQGESIFTLDSYVELNRKTGKYEIQRDAQGNPKENKLLEIYRDLGYEINVQFIREMFKWGDPYEFTIKFKLPTRVENNKNPEKADDLKVFVVAVDNSGKEHIIGQLKETEIAKGGSQAVNTKAIKEELFAKLQEAQQKNEVPDDFIEADGTSKITQIMPGRVNNNPTDNVPRRRVSELVKRGDRVKGFAIGIPDVVIPNKFKLITNDLSGLEDAVPPISVDSTKMSKKQANFFILVQDTSGKYRWVRVFEINVGKHKEVKEKLDRQLARLREVSIELAKNGITSVKQLENNKELYKKASRITGAVNDEIRDLVRYRKEVKSGKIFYEPSINLQTLFFRKFQEDGIFSPEKFIEEHDIYNRPSQINHRVLALDGYDFENPMIQELVDRTETDILDGGPIFVYPAFRMGDYNVPKKEQPEAPASESPAVQFELETEVEAAPEPKTPEGTPDVIREEVSDEVNDILNDDSDPFEFDFSQFTGERFTLDVEQARKDLRSILGDIDLKIVDGLIDTGSFQAYGLAKRSLIVLSKFAHNKTLFHEAFHIVFKGLISSSERTNLLNAARERYTLTDADLASAQKVFDYLKNKYNGLPPTTVEEIALEEKMADEFAEYRITDTGVKGLLKRFFRMLKNFIKRLTGRWDDIDSLFSRINRGYYKQGIVRKDALNIEAFSMENELSTAEINQTVSTGLALFEMVLKNQFASNPDYILKVYSNALSMNPERDLITSTTNNSVLLQFVRASIKYGTSEAHKDYILKIVKNIRPDIVDIQIPTEKGSKPVFVKSATGPVKGPLYIEFLKGLSSRGYSVNLSALSLVERDFTQDLDLDSISEEEASVDFWANNDAKISPKSTAGYNIKRALGLLQLQNEEGNPMLGAHGLPLFHDPNKLYAELQKLIADSSSPEEVMKRISKHNIFSELYDKMLAGKWDNKDPNLPTEQKRINSIANALAMDLLKIAQRSNAEFRTLIYSRDEDGNLITKFIKSNRFTIENVIIAALEALYKEKGDNGSILDLALSPEAKAALIKNKTERNRLDTLYKELVAYYTQRDKITDTTLPQYKAIETEIYKLSKKLIDNLKGSLYEDFQDAIFTVDGERIWEYSQSGFARKFFAQYRNDPQATKAYYLQDPLYADLSIWGMLNGIALNTNEGIKYLGDFKGVPYNKFTPADHYNLMLNSWFNDDSERGNISMPVYTDSPINESLHVKKLKNEQAIALIKELYDFETQRSEQKNVRPGESKNYKKNKNKRFLIPEEAGNTDESINEWVGGLTDQLIDIINNNPEIKKNLDSRISQDAEKLEAFVENFILNHVAYQGQMILLTAGDPAFYKSDKDGTIIDDFFKRAKQLRSPVTYASSDAFWVSKDGDVVNTPSYISITVLPDIEIEAPQLEDLIKVLGEDKASTYKETSLTDGGSLITLDSYRWKKIGLKEWSDGKELVWKILSSGKIPTKKDIDEIIKTLPEDSPIIDELLKIRSFETIKPFIYTMTMMNILQDENVSKMVPIQKKDSETIMYPYYGFEKIGGVENPLYNPFYRSLMEKAGYVFNDADNTVDRTAVQEQFDKDQTDRGVFTFDSTLKVYKPDLELPDNLEENIDTYLETTAPSFTVAFSDWGKMQETPQHHYNVSELFGTQAMKHFIAELDENNPKHTKIIEEYQQLIINNIRNSLHELKEEITDWNSFVTMLRQEVINKNLGDDFLKMLDVNDDGTLKVPLWAPRNHKKMFALLASMFKNGVTKQKFATGFSAVNRSAVGFKRKPRIVFKDASGNIIKEGDKESQPHSLAYIEAIVPMYNSELAAYVNSEGFIDSETLAKMPERLKELIGYRIPTEYKYSTFKIRVIAVDPFSDTITLPHEITKIAGLDFDIDKLKAFLRPSPKSFYQIAGRTPEGRAIFEEYKDRMDAIYEEIFGTKNLLDSQKRLLDKLSDYSKELLEKEKAGVELTAEEELELSQTREDLSEEELKVLLDSEEFKGLKSQLADYKKFIRETYSKLRALKRERNRKLYGGSFTTSKRKRVAEILKDANVGKDELPMLVQVLGDIAAYSNTSFINMARLYAKVKSENTLSDTDIDKLFNMGIDVSEILDFNGTAGLSRAFDFALRNFASYGGPVEGSMEAQVKAADKIRRKFERFKMRQANEKRLFEIIYHSILGDPSQMNAQLEPGGFEYLLERAEYYINKRRAEGEAEFAVNKGFLDPRTTVDISQRMNQGASLVGIAANYVASNALWQHYNLEVERAFVGILPTKEFNKAVEDNTLFDMSIMSNNKYLKGNPELQQMVLNMVLENNAALGVALIQKYNEYMQGFPLSSLEKYQEKVFSQNAMLQLQVGTGSVTMSDFADALLGMAFSQTGNLSTAMSTLIPTFKFEDDGITPLNKFVNYKSVSEANDKEGNSKLRGMANFLAAFVDNGKYPIAEYINMHPEIANLGFALLSLGYTANQTLSIMNTKEFINLTRRTVDEKKRIKNTLSKAASRDQQDPPILMFNENGEVINTDDVIDFMNSLLPVSDGVSLLVEKTKLADKGAGPDIGSAIYSERTYSKDVPFFNQKSVNAMLFNSYGFYPRVLMERGVEDFISILHDEKKFSYPNVRGETFNAILDKFQDLKGDLPLTADEIDSIYLQYLEYLASPLYGSLEDFKNNEFDKLLDRIKEAKLEDPHNLFLKHIQISDNNNIYFTGNTSLDDVDIQNIKDDARKLDDETLFLLEKYSYFSSGFRYTSQGMSHLLPFEAWADKGNYEYLHKQFYYFEQGAEQADLFFDQYIRNNFRNSSIVKRINKIQQGPIYKDGDVVGFRVEFNNPYGYLNAEKDVYVKYYDKARGNKLLKYSPSEGKWIEISELAEYEDRNKRYQQYLFGSAFSQENMATEIAPSINQPPTSKKDPAKDPSDETGNVKPSSVHDKIVEFFKTDVFRKGLNYEVSMDQGYYVSTENYLEYIRNTHFISKPNFDKLNENEAVQLNTDDRLLNDKAQYANGVLTDDADIAESFSQQSSVETPQKVLIHLSENATQEDINRIASEVESRIKKVKGIDEVMGEGGKPVTFILPSSSNPNFKKYKPIIDKMLEYYPSLYKDMGKDSNFDIYTFEKDNPFLNFATENGTKSDAFLRDFFNGEIDDLLTKLEEKLRLTENVFNDPLEEPNPIFGEIDAILKALNKKYDLFPANKEKEFLPLLFNGTQNLVRLRNTFKQLGLTPMALEFTITDDYNRIGTTTDLILVDSKGRVYVSDFKTMRGNMFNNRYNGDTASKYESTMYGQSRMEKHQKQLSIIRIALFNQYGIKAEKVGYIIPLAFNEYGPSDTHPTSIELVSPDGPTSNNMPWKVLPLLDEVVTENGDRATLNPEQKERVFEEETPDTGFEDTTDDTEETVFEDESPEKGAGEGTEEFDFAAGEAKGVEQFENLEAAIINGKVIILKRSKSNPSNYKLEDSTGSPISNNEKGLFLIQHAYKTNTPENPSYIEFTAPNGEKYIAVVNPIPNDVGPSVHKVSDGSQIGNEAYDFLPSEVIEFLADKNCSI